MKELPAPTFEGETKPEVDNAVPLDDQNSQNAWPKKKRKKRRKKRRKHQDKNRELQPRHLSLRLWWFHCQEEEELLSEGLLLAEESELFQLLQL
ncbi:hypothetical protein WMY93_025114 [Mugilogobius chulae]|uniref:Uncharacterized protein n=1 Tax=Mugilogobius chulae TaxID=88201 RepID=A0AAW0N5Y3_9GOBI